MPYLLPKNTKYIQIKNTINYKTRIPDYHSLITAIRNRVLGNQRHWKACPNTRIGLHKKMAFYIIIVYFVHP